MIRLLFLLLLLANGAYFAYTQDMLRGIGFPLVQQSEPERMGEQIRPEAMRILTPEEVKRADAPGAAARAPECQQAGLFDDAQATALRQVLEGWPQGSWSLEPSVESARWMIFMGRYPDVETLNRKKAELRGLKILFQPLPNPSDLAVSLGSFDSQAAANQQLSALAQRGVRTARVVQERAEVRGQQLRVTAVDDSIRMRVDELRPLLAGKSLRTCR